MTVPRTVWSVTVDQIAASGRVQRHGPLRQMTPYMPDAVEWACEEFGLLHVEVGQYQITVVQVAE